MRIILKKYKFFNKTGNTCNEIIHVCSGFSFITVSSDFYSMGDWMFQVPPFGVGPSLSCFCCSNKRSKGEGPGPDHSD